MMDGCVFVEGPSAVCNDKTRSAKRQGERGERHAYKAVTTVRTLKLRPIGEGRHSQVCADTAVAILKDEGLRNVP